MNEETPPVIEPRLGASVETRNIATAGTDLGSNTPETTERDFQP